ncbi:MAG TPA: hypothetical protein VGC04_11210 [Cellulomonas sp.]
MTTTVQHVPVDTAGHWLNPQAAAALERAVAAGCPLDITSAGRTPAEQQHLIELHAAHPALYAYAAPVDESEHVIGNALDSGDRAGHGPMGDWFNAHPGYGFVQTALPAEPWHRAYRASSDEHLTTTTAPTSTPSPTEETDMIVIKQTSTGKTFTAAPGLLKHHADANQARVALTLCRQAAPLELSDPDLRYALWDLGIDNGTDPIARLAALAPGGALRA